MAPFSPRAWRSATASPSSKWAASRSMRSNRGSRGRSRPAIPARSPRCSATSRWTGSASTPTAPMRLSSAGWSGSRRRRLTGYSEHDPDWWQATLEVQHVERGTVEPGPMSVLYANSLDVQWRAAPKPKASQEGLWILHATAGQLAEVARFQIVHPEDYQPVQSLDALRVRRGLNPMGAIRVVNIVPSSLSGETNQDSEPNLAVNPQRPTDIVATAFTPAPMGGGFAPIYVSNDGGNTWALRNVVPGNGTFGTLDITVAFAPTGGTLYAGALNGSGPGRLLQILRTTNFMSTTAMTVLLQRSGPGPAVDRHGAGRSALRRRQRPRIALFGVRDVGITSARARRASWARSSSGGRRPARTARRCGWRRILTAPLRRVPALGDGPPAPTSASTSSSRATTSWPATSTSSSTLVDAADAWKASASPTDLYAFFNADDGSGAHRRRSRARGRPERLARPSGSRGASASAVRAAPTGRSGRALDRPGPQLGADPAHDHQRARTRAWR